MAINPLAHVITVTIMLQLSAYAGAPGNIRLPHAMPISPPTQVIDPQANAERTHRNLLIWCEYPGPDPSDLDAVEWCELENAWNKANKLWADVVREAELQATKMWPEK